MVYADFYRGPASAWMRREMIQLGYISNTGEPRVVRVKICGEELTETIQWFGNTPKEVSGVTKEGDPVQFFFPIIPAQWKYWECVSPGEWLVLYVGKVADIPTPTLEYVARCAPTMKKRRGDDYVALMRPALNPGWELLAPAGIVLLVERGHLIHPRPFAWPGLEVPEHAINEAWAKRLEERSPSRPNSIF